MADDINFDQALRATAEILAGIQMITDKYAVTYEYEKIFLYCGTCQLVQDFPVPSSFGTLFKEMMDHDSEHLLEGMGNAHLN